MDVKKLDKFFLNVRNCKNACILHVFRVLLADKNLRNLGFSKFCKTRLLGKLKTLKSSGIFKENICITMVLTSVFLAIVFRLESIIAR